MKKQYEAPTLQEELLYTNAIMDSEGTADDPFDGVDNVEQWIESGEF